MESEKRISILTKQFEDLCRGFNNLIEDFRRHASYQEECQAKWLETENEVRHLRNQVNDANQLNSKLEAQYHQTTLLLKNEVKVRTHLQEEKKNLEKKLKLSKDQKNENTEPTNGSTAKNSRHSFPGIFQSSRDCLCSENESNSVESISLESSEFVKAEIHREETEQQVSSANVRPSRAPFRSNRTPVGIDSYLTTDGGFKRRSRRDSVLDTSCNERLIATTTVSIPVKGGPITATSVIETHPESSQIGDDLNVSMGKKRRVRIDSSQQLENESENAPSAPNQSLIESPRNKFLMCEASPRIERRSTSVPARVSEGVGGTFLRSVASGGRINQRRHNFTQKTIIKSENCVPCGNRIKFGKLAYKCSDCRTSCHVDCKSRMPQFCVPTVSSSSSKGLAGTLADFAPSTSPMIPNVIVFCVNEVERRGMKEVAIYRVNGSEKEITDLKEEMVRGKVQPYRLSQVNIHVVTGALKLFLRSLREPIITFTLWKSFTSICDLPEVMDVQTAVYALIPDLPQPNRDTLAYLILHLQKVADTPDCKMFTSSLARVFGPIIIGHSRPNPDVELTLKETKKQAGTMEKLLQIPSDYWCRFIMDH